MYEKKILWAQRFAPIRNRWEPERQAESHWWDDNTPTTFFIANLELVFVSSSD